MPWYAPTGRSSMSVLLAIDARVLCARLGEQETRPLSTVTFELSSRLPCLNEPPGSLVLIPTGRRVAFFIPKLWVSNPQAASHGDAADSAMRTKINAHAARLCGRGLRWTD